jgi:hypothetical protein
MATREEMAKQLVDLETEHRDLDKAIAALTAAEDYDRLQAQRLKKRKLSLRDQIMRLEGKLLPDTTA